MGFFSQDCTGCGHPLLSLHATNEVNAWMTQAVSISRDGVLGVGEYDGYGRIDDAEYAVGDGATVWHRACWAVAGKPLEFQGPSRHSADQGFFFDDPAHDMAEPKVTVS